MTAGINPTSALALVEAGFPSLASLEGVTQNRLLAIPGVGVLTLEALELLLGRPLPRKQGRRPEREPHPILPEEVWRRRGVHADAAITFAQVGMTVERLKSITREELLLLRGVGPRSLHACELLIGRKILSRKPVDPRVAFWRSQGFPPRAAKVLSQNGFVTLEDLRGCWREDLLSLRGIGEATLGRLEALLGARIPSRTAYWCDRGLPAFTANALSREGIYTLEDFGRLTREQFLSRSGLGYVALRQCERLLGRRLPSEERTRP